MALQGGGRQGGPGRGGQGRGGQGPGGQGRGGRGPGGQGRGGQGQRQRSDKERQESGFIERIVGRPRRVSKVVKGGRRFSFSALGVVGDGMGKVGVGLGKAREVPAAVTKSLEIARKSMFVVPIIGSTIPHEVLGEASGAQVLLKPASPGTGVIAGGPVRAVIEAAGITDILSKSLGSANAINIVHATVAALKGLHRPEDVAARRGKEVADIAPAYLLKPASTPDPGPIEG